MSKSQVFQLAQLYYGTLVDQQKKPVGTTGIIAHTVDLSQEHIAECLRLAPLVPPASHETSGEMPAALALFRGETVDLILAKAQLNTAGYPQLLYILAPLAAFQPWEGNMQPFHVLSALEMPAFSATNVDLPLFELRDPTPPNAPEQLKALNDLLRYCQDSFQHIENILAALVHQHPIAIINSPPALAQRLQFVQGLLSLLPSPARVGITFSTNVHNYSASQVHIKFMNQDTPPPQHLVYDWAQKELLTEAPEDPYSHYIITQLRLDPTLVVETTEQLARTTQWRAMHKDNLVQALAWISRRAAIDQTVLTKQPANPENVAAILREDPTLSDDVRQAHVQHLLAFTLALNKTDASDIVPVICQTYPHIANNVQDQLTTAIENGQSDVVYALLERWLLHVTEASADQWQPIFHAAAIKNFQDQLQQDAIQLALDFISYTQQTSPVLGLNEIVPDLIWLAQPVAQTHPELAHTVFLLAIKALPSGELYRLLNDEKLRQQLPEKVQTALLYLQSEPRYPMPPQVLNEAAQIFSDGQRMLVLTRLVEWAMYLQRAELVGTAALQALLVIAQSQHAEQFHSLIQQVVDEFNETDSIQMLEPPGPRVLVQLLLLIGEFIQAIDQLVFYQNLVFGPERLADFTELAGQTFRMTALDSEALDETLTCLESSRILPEPRATIYCNILISCQWTTDQEHAARRLTSMIFGDHHLISIIGHEHAFQLLRYHSHSKNALDALRVAAALVEHALHMGTESATHIVHMWPLITWDKDSKEASLELLRRFIRGISPDETPALITYFKNELGPELGEALWATHLVNQVLGEDDLLQFADNVHIATKLFTDITSIYHTNKKIPPIHRLRHDLDTMTGGLSDQERKQVAENISIILQRIHDLEQHFSQKRRKQPAAERFIQGHDTPQNGIDLLHFIGGYFAHQQIIPTSIEREEMGHVFGNRSAAIFFRETNAITRLLYGLWTVFELSQTHTVPPTALAAELHSLWSNLSLYDQRRIQEQFAHNCQQLANVLGIMSTGANQRILSDSGLGQQLKTGRRQPRSALETLRWIHGYFARKHIRTRT